MIFKPDLIHIYQEYDHTNGLFDKYFQHLVLYHLTHCTYQLPKLLFSETDLKLYQSRCDLAILDLTRHSLCLLVEIQNHPQRV